MKEPTWFSQRYHWDAWNVVEYFSDDNNIVPWYFSEGDSLIVNSGGRFYLGTDLREKAADSLAKLWLCVESIIPNPPFLRGMDHLL